MSFSLSPLILLLVVFTGEKNVAKEDSSLDFEGCCCCWKGSRANPSSSYFGLILVFPLYSYDKLRRANLVSRGQCYLFGFCSVHVDVMILWSMKNQLLSTCEDVEQRYWIGAPQQCSIKLGISIPRLAVHNQSNWDDMLIRSEYASFPSSTVNGNT
ncbi:hypothetical protein C5167_014838 [Papaver somniferum]|uniref:Uncharacterized protein n=1 Tax=Papaver somniferum TaxID=3469 RepID=A0A4Y7J8E5_PAPSO|nr:hypothetical protein C5167_014838 [Papaver somniferum]